jgi:hypothetical protein
VGEGCSLRSAEFVQGIVLRSKDWPLFNVLYRAFYRLSLSFFLWGLRAVERRCKGKRVVRVYLRRGGGRSELVPGASDLDFLLELVPVSAAEEMQFLKEFWTWFRKYKQKIFPFWGEALMADSSELEDFLKGASYRAAEAPFSWQILRGQPLPPLHPLRKGSKQTALDDRDLFSEAAKNYWQALHCFFQGPLQPLQWQRRLFLRNSLKALLDLDRLGAAFFEEMPLENILSPSRGEWARQRSFPSVWGQHLDLKGRGSADILECYERLPEHLWVALSVLDRMATELEKEDTEPRRLFSPGESAEDGTVADSFSVSVRELFVERLLRRHKGFLRRALVSDGTTHIYLPLESAGLDDFRKLLVDLRAAEMAKAGVLLPVTPAVLSELPRTSFLDSPFHSFLAHQRLFLDESGRFHSSTYTFGAQEMPLSVLRKTFAEASMALRFQPPNDFYYAIHLVTLVLQLRVAEDAGQVPTTFHRALQLFFDLQPRQAQFLKEKLGRFLGLGDELEARFWAELGQFWKGFGAQGPRAQLLWAQLEGVRAMRRSSPSGLAESSTDLWIELTPFLRLEMQAMRERYLSTPAPLRV